MESKENKNIPVCTSKNKRLIDKIKEHKKEIAIAGATIASVMGTVLITRNWGDITSYIKKAEPVVDVVAKLEPVAEKSIKLVISPEIMDNLTGNKLTATALGSKALCSAQEINKRNVAAGLITKLPCGEYALTEAGRLLGESTLKVTRSGHSFSNIEWDEKILDVIFSPEELLETANKHKIFQEIMSRPAE